MFSVPDSLTQALHSEARMRAQKQGRLNLLACIRRLTLVGIIAYLVGFLVLNTPYLSSHGFYYVTIVYILGLIFFHIHFEKKLYETRKTKKTEWKPQLILPFLSSLILWNLIGRYDDNLNLYLETYTEYLIQTSWLGWGILLLGVGIFLFFIQYLIYKQRTISRFQPVIVQELQEQFQQLPTFCGKMTPQELVKASDFFCFEYEEALLNLSCNDADSTLSELVRYLARLYRACASPDGNLEEIPPSSYLNKEEWVSSFRTYFNALNEIDWEALEEAECQLAILFYQQIRGHESLIQSWLKDYPTLLSLHRSEKFVAAIPKIYSLNNHHFPFINFLERHRIQDDAPLRSYMGSLTYLEQSQEPCHTGWGFS